MMKDKQYAKNPGESSKVNEAALAYATASKPMAAYSILDVDQSRVAEPLAGVRTFRQGLHKKSFARLKEVSGLDNNSLASALGVSSKTLQRKQVFDAIQSEKMYELAELYALGIEYFGEEGFRRWMERPLFSLGNRRPIELIDVSEGMSLLKTEIIRLQHGIAV